jgi:hypothetical protein
MGDIFDELDHIHSSGSMMDGTPFAKVVELIIEALNKDIRERPSASEMADGIRKVRSRLWWRARTDRRPEMVHK